MYERILLPVDGSALSESVIPYVRQLAEAFDFPVTVLHVVEPGRYKSEDRGVVRRHDGATMAIRAYLDDVAHMIGAPAVQTATAVLVGKPAQVIATYTAENAFGLIAMTTHGRSGTAQWAYGSTTDKVLQITATPVLLLRATGPSQPVAAVKTLVVPLDGSPLAASVLPQARVLARRMELEILLVRVAPSEEAMTAWVDPEFYSPELHQAAVAEARDYLTRETNELREDRFHVTMRVEEGFPPERIAEIAERTPNSLLLMCTHGEGGMGGWRMGSVVDRVLRGATRPVLVVRPASR